MKTWQELFAKEREKRLAVKTLLEGDAPDMEQITVLTGEADALHSQGTAMKANAEA